MIEFFFFTPLLGEGMSAYMAYKVNTKVTSLVLQILPFLVVVEFILFYYTR